MLLVDLNSWTSCSQIRKSCFQCIPVLQMTSVLISFHLQLYQVPYIKYLNISEWNDRFLGFPVFSFNCRYLHIFCFLTIEASIKDLKTTASYMNWLLESGFQNLLSQWETDVHVMYRTRDNDGVIFHVSSTVTAEFIRLEVMYMKND